MIDIERFLLDVSIEKVLVHYNVHSEKKMFSCPFHGQDVHPSASIIGRKLYCHREKAIYDAKDIAEHFGESKPFKALAEICGLNLQDYALDDVSNAKKEAVIKKKLEYKPLIEALGISDQEVRKPEMVADDGRKHYTLSPESVECDKIRESTIVLSPFSELDEKAKLYVLGKTFKKRMIQIYEIQYILETYRTELEEKEEPVDEIIRMQEIMDRHLKGIMEEMRKHF